MAQKLEVFQSIWAMERRRPDGAEWSLEEQVAMVADAGFDGMDIYTFAPEKSRAAKRLLDDRGLACTVCAFPKSVETFQADIDMALELGGRHLNIIVQIYPMTVAEGVDILGRMLEMGEKAGMPILVETHRDCITTDMLYTLQLMEQLPHMEMCADLSHFVVAREFTWPVPERDEAWIQQVLDRSVAFQGRVASREQVQVALDFPQHQGWVGKFRQWWEDGMRKWRARMPQDATLNFLVELGPPPYGITGRDGYELSDRWQEAQVIMGWVRESWARLEKEGKSGQD
jgi:hypothetical protein